ncbi:hypothetical protein FBZ94_105489 [Bradyrhizobium sacchari]|uniref:Uncharacterized protein n=1 Tax=Bradyrhizobium sacchari TaxID=1399419 RepID=A0A560IJJ8_9BRAD|nr:hypothetical protein FBZ94_105489 [Bradyrhizobium sacchari]TWB72427.1 hypothetical protein FBZ95_106142 [Bradyrhizobium sacchari]
MLPRMGAPVFGGWRPKPKTALEAGRAVSGASRLMVHSLAR